MNRLYQLLWLLIGIPVFLALGVLVFILITHLDGMARLLALLGFLTLGVAALVIYAVQSNSGNKLVARLLDILHKNADPDTFIRESEAAIGKTRSRALKNTLRLNLAVGYGAAGDYEKAIATMKEMNVLAADKASKALYFCNAASLYAEKGAVEEGLEAYKLGQPYYEKAAKDISSSYITLTRGLLYYAEGRDEDALDAFRKARDKGIEDRHTMTKLQLYEARTLARLGRVKEARSVYGKVLQRNTYPYYLSCARAELDALSEA